MGKWDMVRLGDVCSKGSSNVAQKDIENNNGLYGIYGASGYIKDINFYHQDKPYIAVVKDGAGIGRTVLLPEKTSIIGTMQYLIPNELVYVNYLYYAVTHMNLAKYFTGATIPHIYFKDYQNERFPLPPIEIQRKIAENLDKVTHAIDLCNAILEKLDLLVKARFVEMFGDMDLNSFNWKRVTINDVCLSIVRGPFGSSLKKEFFVPKGTSTYKVYEQKNAIQKSSSIGTYYINEEKFQELHRFECKSGDIIMSCSGTMGELYQLPDNSENGIINQALCKFTLNNKILPIFFLFYMKMTIHNLETKGSGIKNIAAISYVKEMPINLPPLELQNKFADFVEQTEKTKSKVKQILEKIETLKKALMQEYFG